jgi:hypothetical protein
LPGDLALVAALPDAGKPGLAAQLAFWRQNGRFPDEEALILGQQFSAAHGALRAGPDPTASSIEHSKPVLRDAPERASIGYSHTAVMQNRPWKDFPNIPHAVPTPFASGSAEAGARPTVVGVSV